jgi:hypothetical protein
MALDIYVKGNILNVSTSGNNVSVFGRFEYMVLYNECCDYDVIIKLYNVKGYLKLNGEDLEIIKQTDDELKLKDKLTGIKVLDKNGTIIHDFEVESCAVVITERREEAEVDVTQPDKEIDVEEIEEE